MSDESANPSTEPQQAGKRPGRSPVEKIVWVVIALVIAGLGLELYAKNSYEKTMAQLDDVFNMASPGEQRLSDVRKMISGLTSFGTAVQSQKTSSQEEVEVSWLSLSGKYSCTLVLEKGGEDPVVAWYKMDDAGAAIVYEVTNDNEVPVADYEMSGTTAGGDPPAGHGAEGAPGGGGPGAGGGPGGGGRRGPRGLLGILGEEDVIAEINLTPEQTEKLNGLADTLQVDFASLREASDEERTAILEKARTDTEGAVKEVLDESQFLRAWQIDLQRTGPSAIARPEVATQLNLTDEQNAKVAEVVAEASAARRAAMEERNFAAMGGIQEQAGQKIDAVLTDAQKEQWKELLGPPGPEPPARGDFGGGPGGGGPGGFGGGRGGRGGEGERPQRPASDDTEDAAPAAESSESAQ